MVKEESFQVINTFTSAHRKWKFIPEERGSIGKGPCSSLGTTSWLVKKEAISRAQAAHHVVHRYGIAQIGRSLTVDAFESQHQDFELYAQLDRQPVKLREHGSQWSCLSRCSMVLAQAFWTL